jgi:integrase
MGVVKLKRDIRDAAGRKIPLLDEHGNVVPCSRGKNKGKPRYQKADYRDKRGRYRWKATVYDKIARKPVSREDFLRREDAQAWEREQQGRKEQRQTLTGDRRTVAEYMQWWLTMKAKGAVSGKRGKKRKAPRSRTMAEYRELVTKWIDAPSRFGQVRLDELSHNDLDDLYAAMAEKTTVSIVCRLHGLLVQAFEEALRKGSLPHNPADRASVPQSEEHASISKSMDRDQAKRFLAAARTVADEQESEGDQVMPERCWSALWHVLLQTGLRPGEALALRWGDLDLDATNAMVHVKHSLIRVRGQSGWKLEVPKTKNSVRDVPLPALTARELKAWCTGQKRQRLLAGDQWREHGFVFTTSRGTPLGGVRRSFARVCARGNGEEGRDGGLGTWGPEPERTHLTGPLPGREFRPAFRVYDLRHTCVTLWLLGGVPLHVASRMAGHATAAFTATVYAKVLDEQRVDAAAKMDALFGT